jgi:predicted Zn-dependent peptidase
VSKLTLAQVNEALRKLIKADAINIIIAGDQSKQGK